MHRSPSWRRAAAAALTAAVLAGCGSTVQVTSTGVVGQDGLGESLSTDGSLAGTTGGTGAVGTSGGTGGLAAPGTGGTTGGGGSSTGVTTAPGGAPAAGGTSGATTAPRGPVSRTPLKIGVITQQQLESAAKAFGLDGVTTGDTRKQVEAVLAWVKVNGGLAGRPVQVVQYDADLSAGNSDAIMTQACTAFTQDDKVDYVLTVLTGIKVLADCLKKAGVGLLADNTNFADSTAAKYDSILGHPSELAAGRMYHLLVDHLWSTGWLNASSKVGVIARDDKDGHEFVEGPLRAALKRHGLVPKVERFINDQQGDGGSSASGNAVLGFRQEGVDRVIPAGYSPLYFMSAAESQGYRPAYAMVSANGPSLLEGLASPNQLRNSQGIGWQPFLDIGKGTKPGPVSSRETLCFELMRKAGQGATSALVKGFQAQVCDLLFYLKDLTDLRPDLPDDLFTSARVQLGNRYVSPATFKVDVSKRTAGVAGYRPLAYKDDCQCYQYAGPLVQAP